jgi:hypothetical protein
MGSKHVVAGITVLASGLLLTACDWGRFGNSFSDQEPISHPVSEVRFANDSGDVRIAVGDKLEVRRTVHYGDDKPGKTYRVEGDVLVLEQCDVRDCGVDYDVTVPKGTKVSGHVDSGNVDLAGVASVNVEAESGDVTARDVGGKVNASTQSGNVDLSAVGGSVVAKAESGDVTVKLTTAAAVTAITSSGNVDVTVPDDSYQVDITGNDVTNDLGDDPTGPKITIETSSGHATLRAT